MNFIVDESAGKAIVEFLRTSGHDVLSVSEAMRGADDDAILARADDEHRILVTNDKDFGELVYRSGRLHSGILLLRLQDEHASNRVAVIKAVLARYADQLAGNFAVATEDSIRIRPGRQLS